MKGFLFDHYVQRRNVLNSHTKETSLFFINCCFKPQVSLNPILLIYQQFKGILLCRQKRSTAGLGTKTAVSYNTKLSWFFLSVLKTNQINLQFKSEGETTTILNYHSLISGYCISCIVSNTAKWLKLG